MNLLWVSKTPNVKTGNIPTAYVGETREETLLSCIESGCPRPRHAAGTSPCYAWAGATGAFGVRNVQRRSAEHPGRYGIFHALKDRDPSARAVRASALGDVSSVDPTELRWHMDLVRHAGLAWLCYTHGWRGRSLEDVALASTDSLEEADAAARAGYVVSAVVPWETGAKQVTTPAGRTLVVCPALRSLDVVCNDCRLCDPDHAVWKHGRLAGVAFPEHGNHVAREAKRQGKRLPSAGVHRVWKGSVRTSGGAVRANAESVVAARERAT